jgi:chloramphenicol 3-O phosphotransferase
VPADVIVLNGFSSAGKTSIARALQSLLAEPFLTFGIDTLLLALPFVAENEPFGIEFFSDGRVVAGEEFRRIERTWYEALATIARSGTGLIIDEVFLGGGASQARLRAALDGLDVMWVGVDCDVDVAMARERARGDRVQGMVAVQKSLVHEGVEYDLRVDTTATAAADCAALIVAHRDRARS